MKDISNFGKYSMSTMIGSNLLRSSDTFMIGAFLSPTAVAMYSVPAKLFEIVEIPLRSFVATALPNLSRLINNKDSEGLKHLFEKYAGMVTVMLIPFVVGSFIFAEYLVILLGGKQYADASNILRIFAVFALLMPLDRYTGVTLDVLNLPVKNFLKVLLMLMVKIAGNFIVIFTIGEVWAVAISSIFTFASGVILGVLFLKKSLDFSMKRLLRRGYAESKLFALKSLNKFNTAGN
jgi:O-antigen/teichoic acid export membrane protein